MTPKKVPPITLDTRDFSHKTIINLTLSRLLTQNQVRKTAGQERYEGYQTQDDKVTDQVRNQLLDNTGQLGLTDIGSCEQTHAYRRST